jgi:hypothetical protein
MDVFGPEDAPRFASLLAALSPQTSVEMNLLNTLNVWKNWTAAGGLRSRTQLSASWALRWRAPRARSLFLTHG